MMISITKFARLLEPVGIESQISSWRVLAARPVLGECKQALPGWSPARFDGRRRGERVLDVGAIVLDHDDGLPIETIAERWGNFHGVVHTTFSHTPEKPKHRVIIATARCFSATEHTKLWRWSQLRDPTIDAACKDAGRFWFVPAHRPGAVYQWRELRGALLDVDAAIRSLPCDPPRRPISPPSFTGGPVDTVERARRYLQRVPGAVSGQGGHRHTWQLALALVKGFALPSHIALELLTEWNQRCEPPWSQRELKHKVANAGNARAVTDGYLLSTSRRTA